MARALRIQYPGAYYHVTSRGNERKDIYKSRRDREKSLSYLESATERYGASIHGHCMMSNHYHLLLEMSEGNLSQIIRYINGAYTTYYGKPCAGKPHARFDKGGLVKAGKEKLFRHCQTKGTETDKLILKLLKLALYSTLFMPFLLLKTGSDFLIRSLLSKQFMGKIRTHRCLSLHLTGFQQYWQTTPRHPTMASLLYTN